jgi:hypothetical protein
VDNHLLGEDNEATGQRLLEEVDKIWIVRDILSIEYSITKMVFEKYHSAKLLCPSCSVYPVNIPPLHHITTYIIAGCGHVA